MQQYHIKAKAASGRRRADSSAGEKIKITSIIANNERTQCLAPRAVSSAAGAQKSMALYRVLIILHIGYITVYYREAKSQLYKQDLASIVIEVFREKKW